MFRILYANAEAERLWLEVVATLPRECLEALAVLGQAANTPTGRTIPLGSTRLRTAAFRGRQYPQWAYLLSDEFQVRYLVDEQPDDGGTPIVWLVSVIRHKFRGVRS